MATKAAPIVAPRAGIAYAIANAKLFIFSPFFREFAKIIIYKLTYHPPGLREQRPQLYRKSDLCVELQAMNVLARKIYA